MRPGPLNLITDVAGLRVGNAEDAAHKTGTTVLTGDSPFLAAVHVMGGAPGTRETDLLAPDRTVQDVDAIVLSGGSAFGLDAAGGVADALADAGRGFAVGEVRVPIVPAAILFDILNGGQGNRRGALYRSLGVKALNAADTAFKIGSVGAGTGALTATLKGGLGSVSAVLEDGTTVGVLVAANPLGSVVAPGGRHFWAAPFEIEDEFGGLGPDPRPGLASGRLPTKLDAMEGRNTTIAIVATDATLTKAEAKRVATAAHDGMARAILPSHTPMDGDLVFAVSTSARTGADVPAICHAAAACLSRAIARAIFAATPASGDLLPCWRDLDQTGG